MECKENVISAGTTPILVFDFPEDILVSDLKECIIRIESPSYSIERLLESRSVTVEPDKNRIVLLLGEEDTSGFKYLEYADVQLKILYKNIIRISYVEQAVIGRTLNFGAGSVNTLGVRFGECTEFEEDSQYFRMKFGIGYPDEVIRTDNYNDLKDKPLINDVVIEHNHNGKYYGLVDSVDYQKDQIKLQEYKNKIKEEQTQQDDKIRDNATNIKTNASNITELNQDLSNYKKEVTEKQEEQDTNIEAINSDLAEYKKDIQLEQQAQDEKIKANADNISQSGQAFDDYKKKIELEQQAQNTRTANLEDNLANYKIEIEGEQNLQNEQIQANLDAIGTKVSQEIYDKEQAEQDVAIGANFEAISENIKAISLTNENLNNYKDSNDAKNLAQDAEIQANADNFNNYDTTIVNDEKLSKKVDKLTQEAKDKEQDVAIGKNKDDIATLNQTLDNYKKEVTKGFQDERDLSVKEHQEAIDLANTKAVMDDTQISPKTVMSSYETVHLTTCEKTLKGASVSFDPIEKYPISTIVEIKAVKRDGGDYSGWSNVDITQDNGGTHKVYNQELGKPCFGGTYEAHKGKLTITQDSKIFNGSENWEIIPLTDGRKQQFVLKNAVTNSSNDLKLQLCNKYNVPSSISPNFNGVWIQDGNLYAGGGLAETFDSLDAWKAYISQENLQMVYGLAKAEIEVFEQKVINAQSGRNTMYANSGDITITTNVKPLCEGDVDVTKSYVDEKDKELQEQINTKVEQEVGMGLYPTDKVATDNNYTSEDKAEVAKVKDKADTSYVDQKLAEKANTTDIKTKTSQLENDSDFTTNKALNTSAQNTLTSANSYTDGKVEPKADKEWVISELAKKANDVDLPTNVSQLNNDAQYQTKDDLDKKFASLGTVTRLKPNVSTYSDLIQLPVEENEKGDIRTTEDDGQEYIWNETSTGELGWQEVGVKQDLSNFLKKEDIVDTTGTATDKIMSQNAVTEELKKKADLTALNSKQDKLSESQLANINDIPNKANKTYVDGELKTKANKDYVDEQLGNKADTTTVNQELAKKATKEDLIKKQDKLTPTQLENIDDVPNKASKVELNQGLDKKQDSLSTEQLQAIADVANKADRSELKTKLSEFTNDAGFVTNKEVETQITDKGYQTASQVKAIKVDNATNADTLDGKTYQQIIDLVPKTDLSEYTKTVDIPKIKVDNATNADTANNATQLGGIEAGLYATKEYADGKINDSTPESTTSAYSSKKVEDILKAPQYSTLIVNVEKTGISDYKADKTDTEIRNYVNAGGMVVLKYLDQIYEYQKYETGQGAIFHRVDITAEKAEEIDLVVRNDKTVQVNRTPLDVYTKTEVNNKNYQDDNQVKSTIESYGYQTNAQVIATKVDNSKNADTATNATQLGGVEAGLYALKSELIGLQNEDQVNALIENALNKIPFAEGGSF